MSSLIYAWTLAQRSQYFAQQVDELRDLQRQVREAEGKDMDRASARIPAAPKVAQLPFFLALNGSSKS
jgi:hypothetical protein